LNKNIQKKIKDILDLFPDNLPKKSYFSYKNTPKHTNINP